MTVRSQKEIENLLTQIPPLPLHKKIELGVEHYLSCTDPERQHKARQELPFLVQFSPIITKYHLKTTAIQTVNPKIPHGGLTEYPKSLIYDLIPEYFRIRTIDFLQDTLPDLDIVLKKIHTLHWPLMLKADKGERGVGIYFLKDEKTLRKHWNHLKSGNIQWQPSSVQEFVTATHEYCLQFYHYIDETGTEQMNFGGLTLRDIPSLTGDGSSTVRELVTDLDLDDKHKANIITQITSTESDKLDMIPSQDEKVTIVRTASLDYGVVYRTIDLSPEQEKQIIKITKSILANISEDVVCVGRFDIKANSLDDLLKGSCKIIEMNAGGGIPTHVYDERLTISEKYDILNEHFALMFNIGQYNHHRLGVQPSSIRKMYQESRTSVRKKGIDGVDPSSLLTKKIAKYITKLLRRMRWKRIKNRILRIFR